jgi:hypothetical protein
MPYYGNITNNFPGGLFKYVRVVQSSEWAGLGLRNVAHGLSNLETAQPTHAFQILAQPAHGLSNRGPAQPTHGPPISLKIFFHVLVKILYYRLQKHK